MIRKLIAFIFLMCIASPAMAGPLAPLIPILVGALVKSIVVKIILTIVITVAISLLTRASAKKPIPPGIQTERTLTGGANSRTLFLGFYATAGSEACPPMSYGNVDKTPNAFLTQVIALADFPVDGFSRLIVNGEYVSVDTGTNTEHGWPIGGKYAGKGWLKFYDGRQTVADASLISHYSGYVRPWGANKIGKGVAYAILTWQFNADIFKQEPQNKFELRGARLYDWRKDSSVGGSGSHRWDDQSTWEYTVNPIVGVYNVLRGITFIDGSKYGGECQAADLPIANWSAAANVCDETVTTSNGTEPRYRFGFEISVADMEPADAIEEMLKACSGVIVEAGGIYKVRAGPPALPVMFITDGDFIVNNDQDFDPFPGIAVSKNTVYATYPSSDETWNTHDAPPAKRAEYLSEDQGQELSVSLQLPAVPFALQVQRLMLAWLQDDRRWRQHGATFGHYAFGLEPLDVISWTSARNQYTNKLFEIAACDEDLAILRNTVTMRECDPADYDYSVDDELPDPVSPGSWELPDVQAVPGFAVTATTITDTDGSDRRPAILASWTPDAADDSKLLKIQVRVASTMVGVADVTVTNIPDGSKIISDGILPATGYEARAQFIVDRPTQWTSWIGVVTGDVLLDGRDVHGYDDLIDDTAAAAAQIAVINVNIADLNALGAALQDSVDDAEADIIAAQGDISTLQTVTATQGAAITTNATAISNTAGNLATLTTHVNAGSQNLVSNSNFENGIDGWTLLGFTLVTGTPFGNYVASGTNNSQGNSSAISVYDNVTYTVSADMYLDSPGDFRLYVGWFDGGGTFLAYSSVAYKSIGTWAADQTQRVQVENMTPPAGAMIAYVFFDLINVPGTVSAAIHQIKFEHGAKMSAYSQEASIYQSFRAITTLDGSYATLSTTVSVLGSSVTTNTSAISTLNTNYASLSSTVSTLGSQVTTNSSAITTLDTNYASLSSTVSTLGSTVSTNSSAITTLNSNYASLSSTVSAQGASISTNSTAIATINGNITTLFAQYGVEIDVNGYITGFVLNNNGTRGDATFRVDKFSIVNPAGNVGTVFVDNAWLVYDASGNLRTVMGKKP